MSWQDYIAQGATALTVLFAALGIWQSARINKKQANMQTFLAYTERFEKVMTRFPEGSLANRLDLDALPVTQSPQLTLAALLYLNLVSEEFYLLKAGYLDQKLWKIWKAEIQRTIASPLFVREWKHVSEEFRSYPEFQHYVADIQHPTLQRMAARPTVHHGATTSTQAKEQTEHLAID